MRELVAALALWSSAPVSVVLVVDDSSDWCERWSQNLRAVGHDAIEVRFELADVEASRERLVGRQEGGHVVVVGPDGTEDAACLGKRRRSWRFEAEGMAGPAEVAAWLRSRPG
jgi:hypothetical protein